MDLLLQGHKSLLWEEYVACPAYALGSQFCIIGCEASSLSGVAQSFNNVMDKIRAACDK
jgi:hypothetical protein